MTRINLKHCITCINSSDTSVWYGSPNSKVQSDLDDGLLLSPVAGLSGTHLLDGVAWTSYDLFRKVLGIWKT